MQNLNRDLSQFENLSIFRNMNRKIGFGIRTKNDWSAGYLAEVDMSAQDIGVKMCFEYIFNRCLPFSGQVNIFVDVPQRIDHCRFAITFNIVGGLAQAIRVNLLN